MKFSELPYTRPDIDLTVGRMNAIIERLKAARSYEDARAAFLAWESLFKHLDTLQKLVDIRHMRDLSDEFYNDELTFFHDAAPRLDACKKEWTQAMLDSRFRRQFRVDYGKQVLSYDEMMNRLISDAVTAEQKEEKELCRRYESLIAGLRISFDGRKVRYLEMSAYKHSVDDNVRQAAYLAEGRALDAVKGELDEIFDRLVDVRNRIGKKMGYDNYIPVGYLYMERNCYTEKEGEAFRNHVIKYITPLADEMYRLQAGRLKKPYPLPYQDNSLHFRSGNPEPAISAQEMLDQATVFYADLYPETQAFIDRMRRDEMMDLFPRDHKALTGFCWTLPDYAAPYMFVNLVGTSNDFSLLTRLFGLAFSVYLNRERIPWQIVRPTNDAGEVLATGMTFFSKNYAKVFFGKDVRKYYYGHLLEILDTITLSAQIDHFQHICYTNTQMPPAWRNAEWNRLTALYRPWVQHDQDIPFYHEGRLWQTVLQIYLYPFYYLEYALGYAVSLQFHSLLRTDRDAAWRKYLDFARPGGSLSFTELIREAELASPFEEETMRKLSEELRDYLTHFDLSGCE